MEGAQEVQSAARATLGSELDVRSTKESIVVGGEEIQVRKKRNPVLLPWRKLDVAVVIEASGRFRSVRAASLHRLAGAYRAASTATQEVDTANTNG